MSIDDLALAFLQAGGILTPAIAEERWRVLACHSMIARLRLRGYLIPCTRRYSETTRRRWGEYRLLRPKPVQASLLDSGTGA